MTTEGLTPIPCGACLRELARTDGHRLVFGLDVGGTWAIVATVLAARVKLCCPACGTRKVWFAARGLYTERASV